MQISLNTSDNGERVRWYDRPWAAFIFFTRLPLWRIYEPPRSAYQSVVEYWPLTGWFTGIIMAVMLYFGSYIMPYPIAVLLAIVTRIMLTGALHEDGLADFFDGFGGGGRDRQRIMRIMKDSSIGTFGVLGLVFYVLLLFFALISISEPPLWAALTIMAADAYAKMIATQLIMMLPYARTEADSKAHNIYRRISIKAGIGLAIQGMLPMAAYLYYMSEVVDWQYVIFIPCLVMYFLYMLISRRLHGYTGDCCGALFLLVELSVYLTVVATM